MVRLYCQGFNTDLQIKKHSTLHFFTGNNFLTHFCPADTTKMTEKDVLKMVRKF